MLDNNNVSKEVKLLIECGIIPISPEFEIFNSVNETGKCIVADNDWLVSGLSGEIAFHIQKNCFRNLDLPIERIGFKQVPCPTVRVLEEVFYPNAFDIVRKSEEMLGLKSCSLESYELYSHETRFKGPF